MSLRVSQKQFLPCGSCCVKLTTRDGGRGGRALPFSSLDRLFEVVDCCTIIAMGMSTASTMRRVKFRTIIAMGMSTVSTVGRVIFTFPEK